MPSDIVAIALIVAVVGMVFFLLFRNRVKLWFKGFGWEAGAEGSNDPVPTTRGIHIEGATSRKGGLSATDHTGTGVTATNIETEQSITIRSGSPGDGNDPKA